MYGSFALRDRGFFAVHRAQPDGRQKRDHVSLTTKLARVWNPVYEGVECA